jgi:SNF2 family DNA or RNA helicase
VVPLSTLSNWVNEFAKWAPDVIVVTYKGNPQTRKDIYTHEMEHGQFNVVITTYEFIMKDKATLKKPLWQVSSTTKYNCNNLNIIILQVLLLHSSAANQVWGH